MHLTRTASVLAAATLAAAPLAAGLASATPAQAARTLAARTLASHGSDWKKGVGVWVFPGDREALAKSGVSWYYDWNSNHAGIREPRGAHFVPMIWGAKDVTRHNLRLAERQSHILLGFNEPDLPRQANMSVGQALRLWPRLMATGMRLGSPAVAGGAATPGSWLNQFMRRARARHYRVNFITLHWYGRDFQTRAAVSELKSYVQSVWAAYHKPIWVTEFALWRFDPTVFPTPRQQARFVTAATRMLQGLRYVWRYAWFALPATPTDGTTGLFRPGPVATAAGRAFEKVDS
jgi:hypothetical protein